MHTAKKPPNNRGMYLFREEGTLTETCKKIRKRYLVNCLNKSVSQYTERNNAEFASTSTTNMLINYN